MEVFKVVPKLEDLATAAAYKAVEDDLGLCYGHDPTGMRVYLDCTESDQIRHRVKSRLDQTLVGVVGDKVRKSFLDTHADWNIVDHWLFLDCVLRETLQTIFCVETSDWLTSVIGKRSPSLTELGITFYEMLDQTDFSRELEWKLSAVIQPLASLQFLAVLRLFHMNPTVSTSVMGLVGETCRSLSSLTIDCGTAQNIEEDMLALVMGRSVYLLKSKDRPSWCKNGELEQIDVPNEYRTQICSSLRELEYHDDETEEWSAPLAAFTLRNMRLLQKFTAASKGGIEMLYHQQLQDNSFQGQLSLTTVDLVEVKSRPLLRAIGDLCPSLDVASFSGSEWKVGDDDLVSPEGARIIFNKWPKLAKITLYSVSRDYVMCILEAFGSNLLHLTIYCREEDRFNLADFALCPKLESLNIENCTLDEKEDVAAFDPATFLPQLKSFTSNCCLGSRSRFFEDKSSLVSLDLHCSHIGLDFKKGGPLYTEVESVLKGISDRETWSRLETLLINEYAGLSMDMVTRLLPKLRRLKKVILPPRISSCDVLLYESIKNELSDRKPPAVIQLNGFSRFRKSCLCLN